MLYPNSDNFAASFPGLASAGQNHVLQQLLTQQLGAQAQLLGQQSWQPLGNHARLSGLQSLHHIAQSLQALSQHLMQFAAQQFALQQHALQQLTANQLGNAPFSNGLAVH